MLTLYHCYDARSFRPLWALCELGLAYELKMLPFPPRVFAKDYLGINPLGTIPFMIDGDTRMTESSGICCQPLMMLSTIRQDASTSSRRMKSVESPIMASASRRS